MKLSVFCGVSVDGFLARPDDTFDFLDHGGQEPHGMEEFYASVDVIVIGRRTFDIVRGFGKWYYGRKQVVVLSSQPLDFSSIKGAVIEQMAGEPSRIVERLRARGFHHAYIDGGVTIQRFLAAGLLDRLIVTRVPVLIGRGIPLFGPIPHDILLRHIATRTYRTGLVQSEYELHSDGGSAAASGAAEKKRKPPAKKKPAATAKRTK
jgi:dihydrofolate reductase